MIVGDYMFCPNCGNSVTDGDKFCRNCGVSFNPGTTNTIYTNNTFSYGEEDELLRAFIGNNYDSFISNKFNFMALIFPLIYTLYRKCYLYFFIGIITLIIPGIGILLLIVYAIILGFSFNDWYVKKARDSITTIKNTHPGASSEELKQLAEKEGGTSIVAPVIYIVINLLLLAFIAYFIYFIYTNFEDFFDSSYYNGYSEIFDDYGNKKDEYSGGVTEGKIKDLYYKVPSSYSLEKYLEDRYGVYSYNNSEAYCKLSISSESTSLEENMDKVEVDKSKWIDQNINDSVYKNISINGVDGNNIPYTNVYYIINKFDITYVLEFNEFNDTKEECSGIRNEFLQEITYNHTSEKSLDIA